MLIYVKLVLISVGTLLYVSCGSNRGLGNLQQSIGQQMILSDSLWCMVHGCDTILAMVGKNRLSAKVLVYYNAEGCTPCKLKELPLWHNLKGELPDSLAEFLFVLNTANTTIQELNQTLAGFHFEHPVLLDTAGIFERSNPQMPDNPLFHTFLLDRDNRVVLVGSPIGNPKMWELYKSTIDRLVENGGTLPPESSDGV